MYSVVLPLLDFSGLLDLIVKISLFTAFYDPDLGNTGAFHFLR